MHISRQWHHLTHSARGELFNFLIYPFLLVTFSYGVGFVFFGGTTAVHDSSLYLAMTHIAPLTPLIWGTIAILVIVVGIYVLLADKPPVGKVTALVGFALWFFAGMCYALTGGWLTLVSVALPSMMFWAWQYFSLSRFRREDVADIEDHTYRDSEIKSL